MKKLVMERRAYDNKYLHRDFHASTNNAIAYIAQNFGQEALDRYIERYVQSRYQVMTLAELERYFTDLYTAEEALDALETELNDQKLVVRILYCPALKYLNETGEDAKWYHKTTTVMYPALAKKCNLEFELVFYDEKTGKAEFVFFNGENRK